MPTLSIYLGESKISILIYNSPSDFKFGFYPFAFPTELIKYNSNFDKFLSQVLKYIEKKEKISTKYDDIIITSVEEAPSKLTSKVFPIRQTMSNVDTYHWYLVENFMIANNLGSISYYPLKKGLTFDLPVLVNYLSNKFLYPNIVSSSPDTMRAEDILSKYMHSNLQIPKEDTKPILFTGGRFTTFAYYPVAVYLLALDLLKAPGLFNVKIDIENKLPVISGLNFSTNYNGGTYTKESVPFLGPDILSINNDEIFDDEFLSLGNVLVAPGGAECMFETDLGNAQFVEIAKDEIFIFPLEKNSGARIVANGKAIGSIEKNIKGGKLGFVIDTRVKDTTDFLTQSSTQNMEWVKVINERISAF